MHLDRVAARTEYLRNREGGTRVTNVELFFDLVYVFAITQLSHLLLHHLNLEGGVQSGILLLALFSSWSYTTWLANWFDPRVLSIRIVVLFNMFLVLVVAVAIPEAFGDRGWIFGVAYAVMHVGRPLVVLPKLGGEDHRALRENYQRILAWTVFASMFWVIGGFADKDLRLEIWIVAVIVEFAGPLVGFFTPGLGSSPTEIWNIDGHHFAERCQLFLMFTLGESIIIIGSAVAEHALDGTTLLTAGGAFVATVAMWWLFFDHVAELSEHALEQAEDVGRLARAAFTYAFIPIIAGVLLMAVGDEIALSHPHGHVDDATLAVMLGSTGLFLFGHGWFTHTLNGRIPWSRLVGIATLIPIALARDAFSPLGMAFAAAAVTLAVTIWESFASFRRGGENATPLI